jgi:hypothetical protein
VALTLTAYEEVRSHPHRFFIVAGHQTIAGEDVLSTTEDGYSIVEKSDHA